MFGECNNQILIKKLLLSNNNTPSPLPSPNSKILYLYVNLHSICDFDFDSELYDLSVKEQALKDLCRTIFEYCKNFLNLS